VDATTDRQWPVRRWTIVFAAITVAAMFVMSSPALATGDRATRDLRQLRRATAQFQQLANAEAAGYGVFTDAAGLACVLDTEGRGGMGVHYVNGAFVGDSTVDALRPEALLYAKTRHGMRLTGVEYVVFVDAWGAGRPPPDLFGRTFRLVPDGNRYGIPAFYELHVWVWYANPSGTFEDWNPRVGCPDCD
jgi:hypothetical protein